MKPKERPILFSAPMVRALLAGTKTQTRRVVKITHRTPGLAACLAPPAGMRTRTSLAAELCPYGQPGDRLWVREAWARTTVFPGSEMVVYREGDSRTDYDRPWKPGIHMLRRDSRITLEVTGVRVERLQDISEADALAEGTPCYVCGGHLNGLSEADCHCFHRKATASDYRALWESINGDGSWSLNPWVWAVSFKRVEVA